MKKARQILAIIGIILLVLLYVLAFVAAILDKTATMKYLAAALMATIIIPIILWLLGMFLRIASKDSSEDEGNN